MSISKISKDEEEEVRDVDPDFEAGHRRSTSQHSQRELEEDEDAHIGVRKVEAAEKVYGKYAKRCLFIRCASQIVVRPGRS